MVHRGGGSCCTLLISIMISCWMTKLLDSLHSGGMTKLGLSAQGSILSMEKAEFKNVEGKMQLQHLEYYMVLRDVEALPQVLSAMLK